jgi:hypothetical protein
MNKKDMLSQKTLMIFLSALFVVSMVSLMVSLIILDNSLNNPNCLTEEDKMFLVELEYSGGACERIGLKSSGILEKTENGIPYIIPICIEGE